MLSTITFLLAYWLFNRLVFKKQSSTFVYQQYQELQNNMSHFVRATKLRTEEQREYYARCKQRLGRLTFLWYWLRLWGL